MLHFRKFITAALLSSLFSPALFAADQNAVKGIKNIGEGAHTGVIVIDNQVVNSSNLKSQKLSAEDKKKLQKALGRTQKELEGLGTEIERDVLGSMGDIDF